MSAAAPPPSTQPADQWLAALARVMAGVTAGADREGVLTALATGLVEQFGTGLARIWLYDSTDETLHLRANVGIPDAPEQVFRHIPIDRLLGPIRAAIDERRTCVIDPITPDTGFRNPDVLEREGLTAFAGFPLVVADRLLGLMAVFLRESPPPPLLDALTVLAQQAALALEHARVLDESRTLQVVAADIAAANDEQALLDRLVDRTITVFGADAAAVWLLGPDRRLTPGAHRGLSDEFLEWVRTDPTPSSPRMFRQIRKDRTPVFTRDDQGTARAAGGGLADALAREGIVSALRLPLVTDGGGVGGMLALYHRRERGYSQGEIELAQAFTNQIAVALHNARVIEQERAAESAAARQLDRLTTLAQITERLLGASDLDAVLGVVVEAAVRLCDAGGAVVALISPGKGTLRPAAFHGALPEWFASFEETELDERFLTETVAGKAIRTGEAVRLEDFGARPVVREAQARMARTGIKAFIAAPIRVERAVLGVLLLADQRAGALSEDDVRLAQALADQAALAIEQTRLLEESHTLQVISAELATQRDTEALLDEIVQRAVAVFGADACAVWLIGEQGRIRPGAVQGLSDRFLDRLGASFFNKGVNPEVIEEVERERRPYVVADLRAVADSPGVDGEVVSAFLEEGITTALSLPLFQPGSGVFGMVALYHRRERAYSDSEMRLAQAFADCTAVALHNARLAEQERDAQATAARQLDRLTTLAQITERLLGTSDLDAVLRVVVEAAVRLCGAAGGVVTLIDVGRHRVVPAAFHGTLNDWFDAFEPSELEGEYLRTSVTGRVLATGEAVVMGDYTDRPLVRPVQRRTAAAGVRACIAAPLRAGGTVLGVLWVADTRPHTLTADDAALVQALADQAALALAQARLIQESHALQVIAAELAASRDPGALLDGIVQRAMTAFGADGCAVWLLDEDGNRLTPGAAVGLSSTYLNRVQVLLDSHTSLAWLAFAEMRRSGLPQVSRNFAAVAKSDPDLLGALVDEGVVSAAGLPLFEPGRRVIGMLALYHRRERLYSADEVRLAQAFTDQIAVALANARMSEHERRARDAASAQLERLTVLARITEELLGTTEIERVLDVVVESAAHLCQGDGAMVSLIDAAGRTLTCVAASGLMSRMSEQVGAVQDLTDDYYRNSATGLAIARREIVVVDGYARSQRKWEEHSDARSLGVRSFIAAPLRVGPSVIGALWVGNSTERTFAPEDIALIEALADQTALAIDHMRLVRRSQDAAVLEERTRLARDLHDSVTQSVFSLGMMARAAQAQHARGVPALATTLDRIGTLAQDALREMRALLFELQPSGLGEEGLATALDKLVSTFRVRFDLAVTFQASADRRLPLDVETALFRIVQESLANVAKHARATDVTVALTETGGCLRVEVRDNGVGFDPSAPVDLSADGRRGGMGMGTMRERAVAAGVVLQVVSAPGAGTSVIAEAPLPAATGQPAR